MRSNKVLMSIFLLLGSYTAQATLLDFEAFTDSFPLTNEIAGLTFSGGTVLTAGVGLNEIDFPPHSGTNVLAALLGSLTVSFNDPLGNFSSYFTFDEQLSISGFNSIGDLLFSLNSSTSSNLGSNTLINFAVAGVSSLEIATTGGSPFTLDDLEFTPADTDLNGIPEPTTLLLLIAAGFIPYLRHRQLSVKKGQ